MIDFILANSDSGSLRLGEERPQCHFKEGSTEKPGHTRFSIIRKIHGKFEGLCYEFVPTREVVRTCWMASSNSHIYEALSKISNSITACLRTSLTLP